ncbi:FMN-dependent NADH-azoreductase [Silicimonas sp. MF1-12-2]|uniref:FMN-dependent NADH-azoreductase n=1 Tax=Silicimonas sp. MF1-12-2 TaxID=3384793 RepID=UPI0039B5E6B8
MTTSILRIDASARLQGSVSRELNDRIIERFTAQGPVDVATRDLAKSDLPLLDAAWIGANFTPPADRSEEQAKKLHLSDTLIAEIKAADVLLIGLPIYNFGVPAAFKAWVDLVARAGVTFAYSETGPKGLLEGKRAIVTVASGGTEMGSDIDFATGYVRHVLGFIGITDVVFVSADRLALDAEGTLRKAYRSIEALPLAA